MYAFFMRHGEAVAQAETDFDRELTIHGRTDVLSMLERCQAELSAVDQIWSSHYVRAQQTAELAAEQLRKPIVTQEWLSPSGSVNSVVNELQQQPQTVLIVSHQPLIGTLVDELAGLETGRYRMGTAALACIQADVFAPRCGELCWMHQPEM